MYSASSEWNGFSYGCATYTAPPSFSASTGVSTSRLPIFDSSGHPSPGRLDDVSASSSCGVQPTRPEPADGLIVYPSGSVSTVSCRFAVETDSGFSQVCGTISDTFKPEEDSAERVVGVTWIEGSNGTRSHSTIGPTSVLASL